MAVVIDRRTFLQKGLGLMSHKGCVELCTEDDATIWLLYYNFVAIVF